MYRDLEILKESGYEVRAETANGRARYSLTASALASDTMTSGERAAIALARQALSSIEGSHLVRELDAVLGRARAVERLSSGVEIARTSIAFDPALLRTLHDAVARSRKLRIRYRGVSESAPQDRVVHPVSLYVVDQQPYLLAWDELRRAPRKFKIARVSQAKVLRDKALPKQHERSASASSVKVWSTDPVDVRVRIAKSVARFLNEWPLVPAQTLEAALDGAVDVCARVFGIEETVRWVLRWGKNAEAIEPPALRARVQEELAVALANYDSAKSSQLA